MSDWHTLYIPLSDAPSVVSALGAALNARGYTPYDPFPGGGGTPPHFRQTVRLFVAPAQAGWVRVLGAPDEDALPEVQQRLGVPLLYAWLTEEGGGWALFAEGARAETPDAFAPYLAEGHTTDELRAAFAHTPSRAARAAQDTALPPELQALAREQGVDARQTEKLMGRLGRKLLGRFQDADETQAQALLGGAPDLWQSAAGQRVRAIAALLRLPPNWRAPTWQQVRDAYHVHRLRARHPHMAALPGDDEALAAVPDVAAYTPLYLGR